jgi:large subunit ribosomal protein L9
MQVVLLQRVENLGKMGEVVTVKPGYARNFLIPRKKALRATKENMAYFEAQRKTLEALNENTKKDAEVTASKMKDLSVVVIRQAAESGKLYGSVSTRDISDAVNAKGFKTNRDQYTLDDSIKMLGLFKAKLNVHPEISVTVTVNVARSEEEAKLQVERGGALIAETGKQAKASKADSAATEQAEVDPSQFLETTEEAA